MDEHKTKTREVVLEMLNDLPSKDVKPPDNTLFVCKLNKLTQEKLVYQRPQSNLLAVRQNQELQFSPRLEDQ